MSDGMTVVVGAAGGIGAAVARALGADERFGKVVLADVRVEEAGALAHDLAGAGAVSEAIGVDLRDPRSIEELVAKTAEAARVAVVAGIFSARPAVDLTREELQEILDVNLIGCFLVAQAYARAMVAHGGGAICAVGSIAARLPRMRQAAYCASKAGMRQALRVLGMEVLDKGVRINFVAPGPTETEMMRSLASDHNNVELWRGSPEALRLPIPDRRVGAPEDVASAVRFLLSDDAAHIALHDLYVDGGESLGL